MSRNAGIAASLVVALIAFSPAARADDPVKDIIDHEVPALKDGTRIAMPDVQAAILAACERRKFEATVVSPGLITARWVHGGHSFDVSIPFSDSAYSIRYKDSERMDYNPKKQRIDGRLMGVVRRARDSDHWEVHPAGDEILFRLSGEMEVVLQNGSRRRRLKLGARSPCCIVPKGIWHTLLVRKPGTLLFVTPGNGTRTRPAGE